MSVLITGGAGFIGSHVAERLLRQGRAVTVLDELNDFYDPAWKRANLAELESIGGDFRFHQGDICDPHAVESAFGSAPPSAIIHLAARAGVRPSLDNPFLYERVNVHGTLVLLEACRRFGIPKLVFASSSSIYGIANRVPFSEDDPLNLPISPYAATKIAGEKLTYTYSHLYGLQVVCLRFFTVYGPRQRPDLAIRKFMARIAAGKPIPVYGDGSTGRDYTHVDDTVSGVLAALDYDCPWDVFNLGNSHPVMLRQMIAAIESALGRKAVIESHPDQPGDVPITYADIAKARRLLGYNPSIPFEEGIRRMADWFCSRTAC